MSWKAGDLVAVVTVSDGASFTRKPVTRSWAGKVIGPSVIGEGWWMVREINPSTGEPGRGRSRTLTVPEQEMHKP
jgi:hypothetical protein